MLEEILDNNCSPALLYFVFTLIYTSVDLYNTKYTEAGVKLIIMIIMTIILNILCDRGQKMLAYLVVFLPLMFMFHLSGLVLYIFNEKPNVLDSDSDLGSDSDSLTTTVTNENDIKNPGKVIAGQTGYITNQFFKCNDFCKPSSECSYVCHQKGCYKETDEPNNCWEKYKDATKNIDLEEIPGATYTGKCSVNVTSKECSDFAYGYDYNYKGEISGGNKYPSKCFMLNGGNGYKDVYYNVDTGTNCSSVDPCLCV